MSKYKKEERLGTPKTQHTCSNKHKIVTWTFKGNKKMKPKCPQCGTVKEDE